MTGIQWTQETGNAFIGCDKCSAGCKSCYAIQEAWVHSHHPNPKIRDKYAGTVEKLPNGKLNWTCKITFTEDVLRRMLYKKKPTVWFFNSMSDLFHEKIPFETIDTCFDYFEAMHWHTIQILTKRHERMLEYFVWKRTGKGLKFKNWPLPNVWMGVSVEDQANADKRIPFLLKTPSAVRFLSCEPLLGPLDISVFLIKQYGPERGVGIDWVIAGGESGHEARPMHPEWLRSLRDQCQAAEVPFFFKQWGSYTTNWMDINDTDKPVYRYFKDKQQWINKANSWLLLGDVLLSACGRIMKCGKDFEEVQYPVVILHKSTKKKSGRVLDGKEWNEMPSVNVQI